MSNVKYKYMHTTMDIACNKMVDSIDEWCEIEIHTTMDIVCNKMVDSIDEWCEIEIHTTMDIVWKWSQIASAQHRWPMMC